MDADLRGSEGRCEGTQMSNWLRVGVVVVVGGMVGFGSVVWGQTRIGPVDVKVVGEGEGEGGGGGGGGGVGVGVGGGGGGGGGGGLGGGGGGGGGVGGGGVGGGGGGEGGGAGVKDPTSKENKEQKEGISKSDLPPRE